MKKILAFLLVLAIAGGGAYLYFFKQIVPDTLTNDYLKITAETTVEGLTKQLNTEGFITDESNFQQWASWLKFTAVRPGRFKDWKSVV